MKLLMPHCLSELNWNQVLILRRDDISTDIKLININPVLTGKDNEE